jgi:hypothetical protein
MRAPGSMARIAPASIQLPGILSVERGRVRRQPAVRSR